MRFKDINYSSIPLLNLNKIIFVGEGLINPSITKPVGQTNKDIFDILNVFSNVFYDDNYFENLSGKWLFKEKILFRIYFSGCLAIPSGTSDYLNLYIQEPVSLNWFNQGKFFASQVTSSNQLFNIPDYLSSTGGFSTLRTFFSLEGYTVGFGLAQTSAQLTISENASFKNDNLIMIELVGKADNLITFQ